MGKVATKGITTQITAHGMVRTPTCKKPKRRRKKCQWKFTENVEFAAPKESAISALPRRGLAARLPSGGGWRLTPKPPNTADDTGTGRDGAGRLLVKRQTPKWRHGQGILPQYMPLITQLRYLVSALVTAWSLPKSAIAPQTAAMAERVGFEPTKDFNPCRFSRPVR